MTDLSSLETNPRDRAIGLAKSASSLFPGIGPFIVQLIVDDIPGQRIDRLADFLERLAARVDAVEFQSQMMEPENIELLERGAEQSAHALSEDRRQQIATLVSAGISDDHQKRIETKRLLNLLAALDDDQLVILTSQLTKHHRDFEFSNRHESILTPVSLSLGSDQATRDRAALYDLARAELVRLGLLRPHFQKPRKGEFPDLDENTGMMKARGYALTTLGRLLLRTIGLCEPEDF